VVEQVADAALVTPECLWAVRGIQAHSTLIKPRQVVLKELLLVEQPPRR
jgi:hypothetical protein